MDHFFGKLVPKLFNNGTDFILAVIAVKKYVEFITGNTGAKCAIRRVSGKTKSGLTDVLITVIMSVGVIRMLEIVKVKHKEGSVSEIFRVEEKSLTFALECLAVVKTGQCIIIPVMFDTETLQCRGSDIFDQSDLCKHFMRCFKAKVMYLSIGGRHLVNLVSGRSNGTRTTLTKILQECTKLIRSKTGGIRLRKSEHGKEVIGYEYRTGIKAYLIAAELYTGHVHNTKKLCGRGKHIAAQLGDRIGKLVYFTDSRV